MLAEIEAAAEGNIWLVGGANLVKQFLEARLIDELMLFVVPVLLGDGIPLFQDATPTEAKLVGTRKYGVGLVELRYSSPGDRPATREHRDLRPQTCFSRLRLSANSIRATASATAS